MAFKVYSFSNTKFTINHPQFGAYTMNGQGVGEAGVEWANDNSAHNVAADGYTMISKIRTDNGTLTVTCQQVSALNDYLQGMFNALNDPASPSQLWAAANVLISESGVGANNITLTGVSFQKRAGRPFKAQGDMVTWNLMFAEGHALGSLIAQVVTEVQANII